MISQTVATDPPTLSSEFDTVEIDTTRRSVLHRLILGPAPKLEMLPLGLAVKTYLVAAGSTYGLMLLMGVFNPVPMAAPSLTVRLPFLHDWNTAFLFLMSFPTLVLFVLSDDSALRLALRRVQQDQIVTVRTAQAALLKRQWQTKFARINVVAQAAGLVIGAALGIANYLAYTPATVGFWASVNGRVVPMGWVFILSVSVFYALIPVYVVRTIGVSLFLADVVRSGRIRMMPFHPDKCGGLRPVGTLGLRNQYGLSIFGVNVVLLTLVSVLYLGRPSSLLTLIIMAGVAYIVLGPIVFVGPLLPFRAGMVKTKSDLLSDVAQRIRIELLRLREELASGSITREDEELIDRLRKIGAVVDELPVWPFDAGTLRRFLTAYVIPLLSALAYPASMLIERFVKP